MKTTLSQPLKPCPFCGSSAMLFESAITCSFCPAEMTIEKPSQITPENLAELVEKWNERHES
jgi:hypothetical protein